MNSKALKITCVIAVAGILAGNVPVEASLECDSRPVSFTIREGGDLSQLTIWADKLDPLEYVSGIILIGVDAQDMKVGNAIGAKPDIFSLTQPFGDSGSDWLITFPTQARDARDAFGMNDLITFDFTPSNFMPGESDVPQAFYYVDGGSCPGWRQEDIAVVPESPFSGAIAASLAAMCMGVVLFKQSSMHDKLELESPSSSS